MAKKDNEKKTTVRIGISESSQELNFETMTDADKIVSLVNEAIASHKVFQISDVKGREFLVPGSKISYIELGDSVDQKVGFTAL